MILTKRQKELFDYIDDYIAVNGYAPTLEEIGAQFKLSSLATVHKHLSNLREQRADPAQVELQSGHRDGSAAQGIGRRAATARVRGGWAADRSAGGE